MKNKEAIQTGERFRRWFMQYAGQFAFLIILFVVLAVDFLIRFKIVRVRNIEKEAQK